MKSIFGMLLSIIGCLLVVVNIIAYKDASSPVFTWDGNIGVFIGSVLGFNIFFIAGLLLIYLSIQMMKQSK